MKKTILALVAIVMMVCLAVPVSAATIKLNGKVGYENEIDLNNYSAITLDEILNTLELDLGLSITEGEFSLGLGANIRYDKTADNFANIASDDWYAAIKTKNFGIWYSVGVNQGYNFEPLGDILGLGNTIYDGSIFNFSLFNSEDSPIRSYRIFSGVGYTYETTDLLHARPTSLLHVNAQIGRTTLTMYYAPEIELYVKNLEKSGAAYPDITNPLMNTSATKKEDLINLLDPAYYNNQGVIADTVIMLRSQTNLFGSLNIGATVTYADTDPTDLNSGSTANFGLDLTADIPLLGGSLALAFGGTIEPKYNTGTAFFDTIEPREDGYVFYAGIFDVPLERTGAITLDVDFAASQENAWSPFTSYTSIFALGYKKFNYDFNPYVDGSKRLGVAFTGRAEVGIASFNIKLSNDIYGPYEGEFTKDIFKIAADAVLAENYEVNFQLSSEFNLKPLFDRMLENTYLKLNFKGDINDNVTVGANFTNYFYNCDGFTKKKNSLFATEVSLVYNDSFEPTEIMDSADFTLAGSLGYVTGNAYNTINKMTYNLFASIDTLFANKFGLEGGIYLGYNPEMHPDYNGSYANIKGFEGISNSSDVMNATKNLPALVLSLTAKYYFSPSVYLYGTGTFRNWWTFYFFDDANSYLTSLADVSHFYGQIGVTVNTKANTYLNVSMGRSGLADAKYSDPELNPGALPWSYLEIAPKNATYEFLMLNVNFGISF